MRGITVSLAVLLALSAGPVFAEPAYKSGDIAEFFSTQLLGQKRAICIGTAEECGKAAEAAEPKPFDLLVNFEFNSDELTPAAKANLDEFAKALADERLARARFAVEGHTDATGSEGYNLELSERRAAAVVSYLTAKGVATDRFETRGYGKTRPRVADPFNPENRRVETRLTGW